MRNLFTSCELLQSIDFSNLDLQNVTDMRDMFQGCVSLKSFKFNFKTKLLEDISGLFGNCASLQSIDLSGLYTKNIKNISGYLDIVLV